MANAETASNDTDFNSERLIAALIGKHRADIDRIIEMKSEEQQEEIKKYGLNPQAVIDYYKDFQTENAQLRKETKAIDRKAFLAGWGTLLATFGGIALMSPKRFGGMAIGEGAAKKIEGGRFLKWVVATVTSVVAGFIGSFATTKLLGTDTERQSAALVRKARSALERELAIAIENTEQQAKGGKPVVLPEPEPKVQAGEDSVPEGALRQNAIAPRAGFMAEVAKEKAAGQGNAAALT